MARVNLTAGAINVIPATGLDLTAATFDTLATGADNGVIVPHGTGEIALKNATAGAAVFTVVTPQPSTYAALSLVIPDKTYNVADGQTLLIPFNQLAVLKQGTGAYWIDCDVAGEVAVIQ